MVKWEDVQNEFEPDGSLRDIYVRSTKGVQVPLSAFTHFSPTTTALAVNHQGQFPAITLSFNLAPGVALGDAVTAITDAEREMGLPASIHATFQGTAQAFQASLANEPLLILAALLTVYIVLGILYESFIHPLTILSALPFAGFGALVTLLIYGVYLHMRGLRNWSGTRSAWVLVLAFGAVMFTYFVVNLWVSGLHSYAGV